MNGLASKLGTLQVRALFPAPVSSRTTNRLGDTPALLETISI